MNIQVRLPDPPPMVMEAAENLRQYRSRHLDFPGLLARHRLSLVGFQSELDQAKKEVSEAELLASQDALMDPDLTNDAKRKAAVARALSTDQAVQAAREKLRQATFRQATAEADYEAAKDQRRALENAQAAAIALIQAFSIKEQ